jgi:hypothetical protein
LTWTVPAPTARGGRQFRPQIFTDETQINDHLKPLQNAPPPERRALLGAIYGLFWRSNALRSGSIPCFAEVSICVNLCLSVAQCFFSFLNPSDFDGLLTTAQKMRCVGQNMGSEFWSFHRRYPLKIGASIAPTTDNKMERQ